MIVGALKFALGDNLANWISNIWYICSMHMLFQRVVSVLLLASMGLMAIPTVLIHPHEDADPCDIRNPAYVTDACQLAVHHGTLDQDSRCSHNSHMNEQHIDCELCDFLTFVRLKCSIQSISEAVDGAKTLSNWIYQIDFLKRGVEDAGFGRAPPIF